MMEANFSIFHTQIAFLLGLLVAVAVLVYAARRINVAYPVLLVLGGLVLGLIPGLPTIELKPDIVFLLFMPPLLYWESLTIPIRDLRRNLRSIASLAVGLVLFTDAVVAGVAHGVIPGFNWPAAFILGAVVASTDEVAVAEISRHLRLPQRVMAILEGESLLNDAVSVVAFRMAVGAAVTGFFSLAQAGLQFLTVGLGGIAIGLSLGWCIVKVRRLLYDPAVENTISLLTPFAAYLLAESVSASGIIAVVSVGLYLEKHIPRIVSPRSRLQAQGFWQMVVFLLNGLLFILIGFQLRLFLNARLLHSITLDLGYAMMILLTVILARIVWVFMTAYLPHVILPAFQKREERPHWKQVTIVSWAGIRGGIAMATALAVPLVTSAGTILPNRSLIVFIAFTVILGTLLLQGLTLPWLLRWLDVRAGGEKEWEEMLARLEAAQAALSFLNNYRQREGITQEMVDRLREYYLDEIKRLTARLKGHEWDSRETFEQSNRMLRREAVNVERRALLKMRDKGIIDDEVLRRIQHDLDLEEVKLIGDT